MEDSDFDDDLRDRRENILTTCVVCNVNLSDVSLKKKEIHLNRCLDRQATKTLILKPKQQQVFKRRNGPKNLDDEKTHLALALSVSSMPHDVISTEIHALKAESVSIEKELARLKRRKGQISLRLQMLNALSQEGHTLATPGMTRFTKEALNWLFPSSDKALNIFNLVKHAKLYKRSTTWSAAAAGKAP